MYITPDHGVTPVFFVFGRHYFALRKTLKRIVSRTPCTYRAVELALYKAVERLSVELFGHLAEDEECEIRIDVFFVVRYGGFYHFAVYRIHDASYGIHAVHYFLGEDAVGDGAVILRQWAGSAVDSLEVIRYPCL